jgi:hypothetical protein
MEVGEPDCALREIVEMRRLDLAAIAADVGPAHVISDDQKYVGSARYFCGGLERGTGCTGEKT